MGASGTARAVSTLLPARVLNETCTKLQPVFGCRSSRAVLRPYPLPPEKWPGSSARSSSCWWSAWRPPTTRKATWKSTWSACPMAAPSSRKRATCWPCTTSATWSTGPNSILGIFFLYICIFHFGFVFVFVLVLRRRGAPLTDTVIRSTSTSPTTWKRWTRPSCCACHGRVLANFDRFSFE